MMMVRIESHFMRIKQGESIELVSVILLTILITLLFSQLSVIVRSVSHCNSVS
jgi:hypothetical protein